MIKLRTARIVLATIAAMMLSLSLLSGCWAATTINSKELLASANFDIVSDANRSTQDVSKINNIDSTSLSSGRTQPILDKASAAQIVQRSIVDPLWASIDQQSGLKVLQYGEILPPGTRLEPAYVPAGQAQVAITSQNPSWLFMIDEMPGAHFSHPVKLVLVDSVTKEQKVIETEWWPKINQMQVFDKEYLRADPSAIIYYREPVSLAYEVSNARLVDLNLLKAAMACETWAVIVCGFNDLPDTFDEDTNGIYSVLKGLGMNDDHIYYLSPHASHAGVDRTNTIENVEWAINEVAMRSGINDKVLFFYSSHGGVDALVCDPGAGAPGEGLILSNELDDWLDAITCKEMSIIVEACHSGSLIGKYRDGTTVPAESDLTTDGETNRVVFTSASTDTSSYPDVDGPNDPNSWDIGSESIYGYVMAFGELSADKNTDGHISFGEAYQYAWDNDVTRINGNNVPQVQESGLDMDNVYHICPKDSLAEKFRKPLYEVQQKRIIPDLVVPQPNPAEASSIDEQVLSNVRRIQ